MELLFERTTMDFPKLQEQKQKKQIRKVPWTFVSWGVLLLVLLLIARQISVNTVLLPLTFSPRLIPNDSVVYNDSSVIRTTESLTVLPEFLGSTNKKDRLLRIVGLTGEQKYYIFTTDKTVVESYNFSSDFIKLKYLSGTDYAFKLGDGIYLNQKGTIAKVYIQKTGETIEDFEYNSSEHAFYILLKQATQRILVRIGAFGEQELFSVKREYTSPIKFLDISGNITIQDSLKVCAILDMSSKVELLTNCIDSKQNAAGINYYIKNNTISRVDINSLTETEVFTPNDGVLYSVIQHEDEFGAVFSSSVVSLLTADFLYISTLNKTLELPSGFRISDFYIVNSVVYITNGKTLFAQDTNLPVSATQSSWQVIGNDSSAVTVEFVY